MRRRIAVVETPMLAGQGLAAWIAAQPGFAAWVATDWQDARQADVVLLDMSRGESHGRQWLGKAPHQPLPVVAIESEAHPLPEHWRAWVGPEWVLTVPVAGELLLATLRDADLPAAAPAEHPAPPPAPWSDDPIIAWEDDWDGIYFQTPAAADAETKAPDPLRELTRREREIARLVSLGLSNREIGERLFVAVGTVRKHRENLMTKLEIRSALGLSQWAQACGLISPDEFALTTQTNRRKP